MKSKLCRNLFSATTLIIAVVTMMLLASPFLSIVNAQQVPNGPYVDKIIYFGLPGDEETILKIKTGEAHMRWWGLRTPEAVEKAKAEGIKLLEAPSGTYDLLVNPVPFREGFNPFSLPEVREALNYLIDREFIAKEIMKGLAVPRTTLHRTLSPDYVRNTVFMRELESKYSYDFDKAKLMIFEAMGKAGATFEEGKWMYNGQPVLIKFSIRVEDLRRNIGDYIASQLEKVGFTVERMYQRAAVAFGIVYAGDPAEGQWNLYTEGWAYTAITAYEDTEAYLLYVSPGTDAVHTVYKPSPLLVDVATRLNEALYSDLEERNRLVRQANELALKDSVRVWLVDQLEAFPYSPSLAPGVSDLYGGPYGILFGRTMRLENKVGGEAKIGSRIIFVSAYLAMPGSGGGTDVGFNWLFDGLVFNNIFDPGVMPHPHTGRYMPVRADFKVETGGVTVPADALIWSWTENKWVPVGEGVTALSKVTFKATLGKWHHGAPIEKADIMMFLYEALGLATPESPIYDVNAISPGVLTLANKFKGIRWISDDTYEIYIDYTHPDETYIAAQSDVFPFMPWEVYSLVNAIYEDRRGAFSETTAGELGVDQIDLTKGATLDLLREYYDQFAPNYVHPAVKDFVKDPAARWNALKAFVDKYGHYLVMSGPFFIEKVDVTAEQVILSAFRDYPFPANKWDHLLSPKVPLVDVKVPTQVVPGLAYTIEVSTTVAGQPYGNVVVQYVLEDPAGKVVKMETAQPKTTGLFEIKLSEELTSGFAAGVYRLTVIAIGGEAALATIKTQPLNVVPQLGYIVGQVGEIEKSVSERLSTIQADLAAAIKDVARGIDAVTTGISSLNTNIVTLNTAISDLRSEVTAVEDRVVDLSKKLPEVSNLVTIAIILAVVAIIISAIAAILALRPKKTQ